MLILLAIAQACIRSSSSSRDFVVSLEGQLVFQDFAAGGMWQAMSFSNNGMAIEQLDKPEPGIFSEDKEWLLLLVEEEDTNGDGVIDWRDLSSLYLARAASSEKKQVDLPFPVHTCAWGTEYMIAACSFASSDVNSSEDTDAEDNNIVYVVNLASGELLRRLSDPAKTSWDLRWSPDGSMIAFQVGTRSDGRLQEEGIQVVDVQTGELVYEIVESSASEPTWSPDGTRIAFVASLEPGIYSEARIEHMYRDVFYVHLGDGTSSPVNITQTSRFTEVPAPLTELGGIWVRHPLWSPDGKAIASVWSRDSSDQIWITEVDGDEWAQLTRGAGHSYYLVEWRP
jgi:hypothetical protein